MPFWINLTVSMLSLLIAGVSGIVIVPYLHKLKFGQPIKTEFGPEWHAKKQGTPTMGGFMFILSTMVVTLIGYGLYKWRCGLDSTDPAVSDCFFRLIEIMIFSLGFGAIGFIDDFIKVKRKNNDGLTAWQKVGLQTVFSIGFLTALYFSGDTSTVFDFGFFSFDAKFFYYIIMIPAIIYLTNAVNLTDGVDGLCGSVTFVAMLVYTIACAILRENEVSIYTMALAGGCLGFLFWNFNPAKCFMGDTGSMFLGASVTAVGIVLHQHLLLLCVALVYICEALSVVIQVSYFKYTAKQHYKKTGVAHQGKRIFKMTPIHHHFEMSGYSEYKIVITFSAVGIIAGILGILTLFI